jgi:hypothetical protein
MTEFVVLPARVKPQSLTTVQLFPFSFSKASPSTICRQHISECSRLAEFLLEILPTAFYRWYHDFIGSRLARRASGVKKPFGNFTRIE